MELRAKYTLFAEGCRGHIGKQLIRNYRPDAKADAQHYGIGIKELWEIDPSKHEQALVVHTAGWPLNDENPGGSFLVQQGFDTSGSPLRLAARTTYRPGHMSHHRAGAA
ncbi:hypothetical protein D9M71_628070 [compost metagenome]